MTFGDQNRFLVQLIMNYEDKSNRSVNFGPSQHIGEVGDHAQIAGPSISPPAPSPSVDPGAHAESKRFFITQVVVIIVAIGALLGAIAQALGPYFVDKLKERDKAAERAHQAASPPPIRPAKFPQH